MGSCKELGTFKSKLARPLRNSEKIKILLLGSSYSMSDEDVQDMLDEHIFSHLYVDGTVTKTESYIFYDVIIPRVFNSIKRVRIVISAISHRSILDKFSGLTDDIQREYPGNRGDKMAQVIEEILCDNEETAQNFGIGNLELVDIDYFNTKDYYGRTLTFEVPNFR